MVSVNFLILGNEMPEELFKVSVNGKTFDAISGSSLFSLLINNHIFNLKKNMVTNQNRFGICGMGTCFECEVFINDLGIQRACLVNIESDLEITSGGTGE